MFYLVPEFVVRCIELSCFLWVCSYISCLFAVRLWSICWCLDIVESVVLFTVCDGWLLWSWKVVFYCWLSVWLMLDVFGLNCLTLVFLVLYILGILLCIDLPCILVVLLLCTYLLSFEFKLNWLDCCLTLFGLVCFSWLFCWMLAGCCLYILLCILLGFERLEFAICWICIVRLFFLVLILWDWLLLNCSCLVWNFGGYVRGMCFVGICWFWLDWFCWLSLSL